MGVLWHTRCIITERCEFGFEGWRRWTRVPGRSCMAGTVRPGQSSIHHQLSTAYLSGADQIQKNSCSFPRACTWCSIVLTVFLSELRRDGRISFNSAHFWMSESGCYFVAVHGGAGLHHPLFVPLSWTIFICIHCWVSLVCVKKRSKVCQPAIPTTIPDLQIPKAQKEPNLWEQAMIDDPWSVSKREVWLEFDIGWYSWMWYCCSHL